MPNIGPELGIPQKTLPPERKTALRAFLTAWMIRHLDGNPWLQTDRCEDERYVWLHDAKF